MMPNTGPPDRERPGPTPGTGPIRKSIAPTTDNRQITTADHWRDAFRRGALDALRLAGREVDCPHAWGALERIAARYESDDYGVAS